MKEKEAGMNKRRSMGWRSFAIPFCLLVLAQQFGLSASKTEAEKEWIRDFITKNGLTYEQYQKAFESQIQHLIHPLGIPRLFSLCVTYNQTQDKDRVVQNDSISNLFRIRQVIGRIEGYKQGFYHFKENLDYQPLNTTLITSVKLSRINTPEPDMVNMRQWIHITVETNETVQALYLQAIGGPFGLPFGEFSLDFPCQDIKMSKPSNLHIDQLAHCAYRPRTSIVHPNVYIGYAANGRHEWHVHLKYFDLNCMSSSYFQLIMIAVKNFDWTLNIPDPGKDYVAQLSQVFHSPQRDSIDGGPYPYYPEWKDKMFCNNTNAVSTSSDRVGGDSQYEDIPWKATNETKQIQASEEYDFCLRATPEELKNVSMIRDEKRYECSPGPFKCDESYNADGTNITIFVNKLNVTHNVTERQIIKVENSSTTENCTQCIEAEGCTGLGFKEEDAACGIFKPPEGAKLEQETKTLNELDVTTRGKNHGSTIMIAFLFFIPLANYIARFCKDMGGKLVFGNGPWLFLHCAFSLMAIVFVSDSIGNVFANFGDHKDRQKFCLGLNYTPGNGKDEYEDCMSVIAFNTPHNWLGIFTICLLVLSLITGFFRPSSTKLRTIIDMLHSHIGYFTWIMALVTTFVGIQKSHCPGGLYITSMAIVVPVIFSVVGVLLDIMEDKQLKIIPGRKQWPVYEQVELEGRGPCDKIKWVAFGVYTFCMVAIMFIIVANSVIIEQSGEEGFEKLSSQKSENSLFTSMHGIFGECKPTSINITKSEKN